MEDRPQKVGKRVRKSRKSIETWGPAAWTWLHTVAFDYALRPTSYDRQQALAFLESFARAIPCPSCRRHFNLIVAADLAPGAEGEVFASREAYSRATVRWHNSVNELLGKPIMPYEAIAREFEDADVLVDDDCLSLTSGSLTSGALTAALNVSPPSHRPTARQRLGPGPMSHSPHGNALDRLAAPSTRPPSRSLSPLATGTALFSDDAAFNHLAPGHLRPDSMATAATTTCKRMCHDACVC